MKIELPRSEYYHHFTSRLKDQLPSTKATWLPFMSVEQALFDLASSMALTYSHKMSLAVMGEESPFFRRIRIHFSRLGYNVQSLKRAEFTNCQEWVDGLNKDTLFVLAEEDDALTGELFDLEEVQAKLNEKKIFQIFLSHNLHKYREWKDFEGFESRIYATQGARAVVGLGTRAKVQPVHVLSNDWRFEKLEDYTLGFATQTADRGKITEFEGAVTHGGQPYFSQEARLFDRAALVFSGASGDAVRGELLVELPASRHDEVATLSLCHWKELDDLDGFKPTANELVLIDQELVSDGLAEKLKSAYENVLKMQGS